MSSHHDHHHHHHDHDHHQHGHHHDHDQDHAHGQGDADRELSFKDKLVMIFDHWIKHNESHAQTYIDWGKKAQAQGLEQIAGRLDEIAKLSDQLTEKLKAGLNDARKS